MVNYSYSDMIWSFSFLLKIVMEFDSFNVCSSSFQILGPLQTVLKLVLFHFLPNDQSFVSSCVSVQVMKDWNEVTVELVDSLIHYTGILEVIIFWKP